MEKLKFGSHEWCLALLDSVNADREVYNGFTDPNIELKLEINVTRSSGPPLRLQALWKDGKGHYEGVPENQVFLGDDLDFVLETSLDFLRRMASDAAMVKKLKSGTTGGELMKFITMGQVKLAKGEIQEGIKHIKAMEKFLYKASQIPTDWNV